MGPETDQSDSSKMVSYVLNVRFKDYDLKYSMLVSDNLKKSRGSEKDTF